jgi:hypothetical protein
MDITRFLSAPFPPYTDGVFSCWKMSIQALIESNPNAIDLLRLCSFLSPDGISYDLLYRGLNAMKWLNNGTIHLCNLPSLVKDETLTLAL